MLLPTLHSQTLQQQLLSLFLIIESPHSDSTRVNRALKHILQLGPDVIPHIQKRFKNKRMPCYYYLLQKLQCQQETDLKTSTANVWNKDKYFLRRYQQARHLLQTREIAKALRIAQAILALEPDIHFAEQVQDFVRQCKDRQVSQRVVGGEMRANSHLYVPGQKLSLTLSVKNRRQMPLELSLKKNGIVVKICMKEFDLYGQYREKLFSRIVPLGEKLLLAPGNAKSQTLQIANDKIAGPCYRIFVISAQIPRSQIRYGEAIKYSRIIFNSLTVSSLPRQLHCIVERPLAFCLGALKFDSPRQLFYASFFVKKSEQATLISALIGYLGQKNSLDPVIYGIIRRLTGKNFTTREVWRNWWNAHRHNWQ